MGTGTGDRKGGLTDMGGGGGHAAFLSIRFAFITTRNLVNWQSMSLHGLCMQKLHEAGCKKVQRHLLYVVAVFPPHTVPVHNYTSMTGELATYSRKKY